MNANCNSEIKHPENVRRLPWWLRLGFTHAEKRLTPKLREELRDVSEFLNVSSIDDRLPLKLRRTCESLGAWLDRFLAGEEAHEASMRVMEEDEKAERIVKAPAKTSAKKKTQAELPLIPA